MNRTMKAAAGLAAGFRAGSRTQQIAPTPHIPTIPHCPPGQVVWAHFNDKADVNIAGKSFELDADMLTYFKNNPAMFGTVAYFFCALPHNQTERPAPVQSARQALTSSLREQALPATQASAIPTLPQRGGLHGTEDSMNRTMKQAAGLAAGFMTQLQHQQTRPAGGFYLAPGLYKVVAEGGLNLRQTPAGQIITVIPDGQMFGIDNHQPAVFVSGYWWVHGKYGQHLSGWVAGRYLVAIALDNPFVPQGAQSSSQALTSALRSQAMLPTGGRPTPGGGGGGYQVSHLGVHGLSEDTMQSDLVSMAAGLGALFTGLAVPGPYGANPAQMVPAGTYEISGTGVEFRDAPSLGGAIIDTFNPDMSAGNSVVGTPDQVAFNGQTATSNGLTWANVTAKGKTGFVAVEYMAPVGWTAQQGKVVPKGQSGGGGGGGNIQPASDTSSSTTTTDYTPYILGGAAVLGGGIILWAVLAKPKKGGGKRRASHRRHAHA